MVAAGALFSATGSPYISVLYFIGCRLRLNHRFVVLLGALLVAFYTLMTGLGASVLRAAIMIEYIILGKLIDRSANSISLIFLVAFLMLLYNPLYISLHQIYKKS